MELPDLGKCCADKTCKQLDFLPLFCHCGKIFCSSHFKIHSGTCIGSKFVPNDQLKRIEGAFLCSKEGCKERSIVHLVCQKCHRHFCIQHRHLNECSEKSQEAVEKERARYTEPMKNFNAAKALVDKEVAESLAATKKKLKNKDTAMKVQLMKIKNKATGPKTIPITDRVYFNINIGDSSENSKARPVFVSKTWSLGRTIDAIATECKLQNNNNKSTEKKLRLFKTDDKNIVYSDMSVIVDKLLCDKLIMNGDDLIIEYVYDHCVKL